MVKISRGEVWIVNFGPSIGGEIRKQRPAIIVSNDATNRYLNRVRVIPLSSRTDKLYPSEAYLTVNGKTNKAMADQLTTVNEARLAKRIAALSPSEMAGLERAVRIQLGLAQY